MDKKQFIKDLLPDLLDLIDRKLSETTVEENQPKQQKKRGRPKKQQPTPQKQQQPVETEKKVPREDFAGPNKFVDDLSVAAEFIEIDKKICTKNKPTQQHNSSVKTRICGMIADEKGREEMVAGCGREFESLGGYLCDRCLGASFNASR